MSGLARFRAPSRGRIDGWLLLAVLALLAFGLIMISSASIVLSSEQFDSNFVYTTNQLTHVGLGLVALTIGSLIDYRLWQRWAPLLLVATFVLLLMVFIPGIGDVQRGTRGWLNLGPLSFQAAEVAKVTLILYFAAWFSSRKGELQSFTAGFLPFLVLLGAIVLLIMLQPDAGTTMVIVLTIVAMYVAAGLPWTHFLAGAAAGGSLLGIFILSAPYRLQRLMTFLNPSAETLGAGYHINQAYLAIGAGGVLGLGFGQSRQKFLYLPEPHTDSIFAIAIEELGFIRVGLVLLVLLFVILRGYRIAEYAADDFGRYVAVGITSLIAIQTFVNLGAMLGLMPLTGVTLPFISYGGSSVIALMGAVGILLNVSRQTVVPSGRAA
ncbi:MAG: putative lipid II flippase FtsW [Patescibacteria group bacterium]|jgi:cell division protein FtsW